MLGATNAARDTRRGAWSVAIGLVLVVGVALRVVQYLDFVPLWHDEAALGRNLDERGFAGLIARPLAHDQVAPAGWLVVLELASRVPARVEAALRFPPFLVSLAALLLFWRVARRFLEGAALAGAVLFFAVAPPVVWYATSLKQYGADIAASLFLVWLALRQRERPEDVRRASGAALAGAAAELLSFPAVAVAPVLGALLLVEQRRARRPWRPFAVLAAGWGGGALLATFAALRARDPATNEFLQAFWSEGFLPWASPAGALLWLPQRIWATFAHFLVYDPPQDAVGRFVVGLPLLFALFGIAWFWRRRDGRALLLLAPTLAAAALGAAHVLPFRHRVGVYAMWPLLVLALLGIQLVLDRLPRQRWLRALAFLPAAPLALFVAFVDPPPYRGQATRPVLEALRDQMAPGELLYVTCGGRHAIAFYGPRLGIPPWIQGGCDRNDPTRLLGEVDRFAGVARLWIFSTQSHGEAELLRERLATLGHEVEEIKDPWGNEGEGAAGAVLFDLRRAPAAGP